MIKTFKDVFFNQWRVCRVDIYYCPLVTSVWLGKIVVV